MYGSNEHFFSKENAKLRVTPHQEFLQGGRDRLGPARLHPGVIYEARGTSRKLESADIALSFDVTIDRIHTIVEPMLTFIGFRLLLLNDDYTPIGHSLVTMRKDTWKPVKEDTFTIHKSMSDTQPVDTIRFGYLVDNGDTTLNDLIQATSTVPSEDKVHRQFRPQPQPQSNKREA